MTRVLVVDDSPAFRALLRGILAKDPQLVVVGEAPDGDSAVQQAAALRPDVITLDVHMPRQNGLEAIREIMRETPTPIVVLSGVVGAEAERITFQALGLGALEVVPKPRATDPAHFASHAAEIRRAIRLAARVRVTNVSPASVTTEAPQLDARAAIRCVGIVASTGGPAALQRILSALPGDFPVPILVVQHLSEGFTPHLASWLGAQAELDVGVATDGEELRPGTVRVAPGGAHLVASRGRLRLDRAPEVRGFRPSGSVLLASLARELGPAACGVVLTGMGDDGVSGLRLLRDGGGVALAQGEHSSVVWGMPRQALESGAAERAVELEALPAALLSLCGGRAETRRRRLLLVDDSETILTLERHLLARDYELFVARDGHEATLAAPRCQPDGILMDFHMPRMDGVEAVRRIRAQAGLQQVPVIMVSSETHPDILRSFEALGCAAVLSKPIDPRTLCERVKSIIPTVRRNP